MPATTPPILERGDEPAKLTLEEDLRQTGQALVRVLPLLGAIGLATLYLIGAMVKAGQLQASDVSVADALRLVPLSQLLAGALPVMVPSVVLLPASVIVLNTWWHTTERIQSRWSRIDRLLRRVVERHQAISAQLDELELEPSREGLADARRATDALHADVGRLGPVVLFFARRRWFAIGLLVPIVIAYVAFWMVTSPVIFVAVPLGLTAAGALRHRPFLAGVAVYGVFFGAVLLDAYAEPPKLPMASVRTIDHVLERGRLIAATDTQWHLAVGHGTIRSIPTTRIVASRVDPGGGGGASEPMWKRLRDLVK